MAKIGEENTSLTLDAALTRDKEYKQVKELKKRALEMRKMGRKYKRKFGREEAEQRRLLFQEAKSLGKEASQLEEYLSQRILETAQVIATTLIGTTQYSLSQIKFDVVVMDEAAQALEPAAWVAIQQAPKVIMAGDPFQLPPTVKSREAEKMGLTCTLMEKAMKVLGPMGYLTEQYRMNQQIMGFSNAYFYHNRLTAHESVALHEVGNGLPPLVFLDTAGCGYEEKSDGEDGSKSNPEEAVLVVKHAERWLNEVDCSVAVISPYRAQVEYLEEHSALRPNYKINTIDSFQGQEADVVYISLVRSNAKGEIGFLKDYRRMNVAMTRARKSLVVIGDSATLAKDRFYEQFLNYVEEHGSYSSAWEYVD
jgi:predicted DNA helicase